MTRGTDSDGTLPSRLHPSLVRDHKFPSARFGRRGLDPQEVRRFQHRVALEMATLHQEVARLTDENTRVKRVLRDWRSGRANQRQS
ncbi:hypothetical protein ACIG87_24205 [Micromonospora sp. NPDC051925]|uniref:hypothetical protein n=1 Tax=Micromonospora sp. NPDC051925 TaxID=3364288 RepID=UPI0037C5FB2C